MTRHIQVFAFTALTALLLCLPSAGGEETSQLTLVVMDPLAAALSCPCVEGYAQRDYEALAQHLERDLQRTVKLKFAESLEKAKVGNQDQSIDLVIGKDSVVRYDAKKGDVPLVAVARLSGKDGKTTQTGLIVVAAEDPAKSVRDLKDHRIFFGTEDSKEKHQAAKKLLKSAGVPIPEKLDLSTACSDGACKVLELAPNVRAAAVISSYAKPLLEGCGTIDRGALRLIGETKPVPFISAFVNSQLPKEDREKIQRSLLSVATDPKLSEKLESLLGFLPLDQESKSSAESPSKKN